MRVVIDARTLQAQHSGVGTYVRELVRALAHLAAGHEFRLLVHRPELVEWSALPGFARWRTRFSHESHPWGDLWESLVLPRQLRREGVEVFHGPAFQIPLVPARTPMVVTVHDLVAFRHRETIPWRYGVYMRSMTRLAAARARRIIVVSGAVREEIATLRGVDADRVRTIPLAVGDDFRFVPHDEEEEERRVLRRHGLTPPFVLYVGNLEPRKNLPLLVRAFARVQRALGAEITLALSGKWGWRYEGIRREIERSPARESIRLLGYVPREDLPALYRAAAVFAFPSVWEGFGLPVLEAMAAGAPVVAAAAGAIPEVAGEAALLVPPGDEEALASAISRVISDAELARELRARGRDRAAAFSWAVVARRTLDVYLEAAGD